MQSLRWMDGCIDLKIQSRVKYRDCFCFQNEVFAWFDDVLCGTRIALSMD